MAFTVKVFVCLSLISSAFAIDCEIAPECPDIVTWTPGIVCEENYTPIIKNRLINGEKLKTICCKDISTCVGSFWCFNKNETVKKEETTAKVYPVGCTSGCVPKWKPYNLNIVPEHYGFKAGLFSPILSSIIGRTYEDNVYHIGRIQLLPPTGLYYTLDGSTRFTNKSIEFLVKGSANYKWINSSHGEFVKNAVTVTASMNLPYYVGRKVSNGFSYIGTVVRVLGKLFYGDANGIERSSDCYEVLVCEGNELSGNEVNVAPSMQLSSSTPFIFFEELTTQSTLNSQSTTIFGQSSTTSATKEPSLTTSVTKKPSVTSSTTKKSSSTSRGTTTLKPSRSTPVPVWFFLTTLNNRTSTTRQSTTKTSRTTTKTPLTTLQILSQVTEQVTGSFPTKWTTTGLILGQTSSTINHDHHHHHHHITNKPSTEPAVPQTATSSIDHVHIHHTTNKPETEQTTPQISSSRRTRTRRTTTQIPATTQSSATLVNGIFLEENTTPADANQANSSYACVPRWKALFNNRQRLTDVLEISSVDNFLGRSTTTSGIYYGRVQLNPTLGLFYVKDNEEKFTTSSLEYMISNPKYIYNWIPSRDGDAVKDALVLTESNNWPFYWGKFEDDGKIYAGKVLPHIGLQYADGNGVVKIAKKYDVLTCSSTVAPVNLCRTIS